MHSLGDTAPVRILNCLLLLILLTACTPAAGGPALSALIAAPPPPPTAGQASAWRPLAPGLETLTTTDGLTALRHSPAAVRYAHRFDPDPASARSVGGWLRADASALAAINCGFYWENGGRYQHLGLLMTNGQEMTKLRRRWGGVLIVRDGEAFVAPNPQRLLAPAALGLQGWPMLAEDRRTLPGLDARDNDRRTAVGVDGQGRVVWVVDPAGRTLMDFARRLLAPDLGLIEAVNLDGGASTGLRWRAAPGATLNGPESLPVPCVILLGRG